MTEHRNSQRGHNNNEENRRRERIKLCRTNCKTCAGCGGRNYERCYEPCRICDSCTRTYNPYYDSPYHQRWQRMGGFWSGSRSPTYGGLSYQGYYQNPYMPRLSECEGVCNSQVCRVFRDRKDKYDDCLEDSSERACNRKWGCKNPKGFLHPNTPPLNPKRTGCTGCWQSGYRTW
jgi:hypothetical protein